MTQGTKGRRFLIGAVLVVALQHAGPTRADPPTDYFWEPIPELSDEFNAGPLDTEKWHDHNPTWEGRQPGWFNPANVAVSGGELLLTARRQTFPNLLLQGYRNYTTAAVKSRKRVLYGYFEARTKPMASSAASAFWFYDNFDPSTWTEIDVFELCGKNRRNPWMEYTDFMTAHVFALEGTGATFQQPIHDAGVWQPPYRFADGYHVFGLEWDAEKIVWLVDGVERRRIENRYWHQPIYMNFDSEIMTSWFGNPSFSDLPSIFRIDYVRAWAHRGEAGTSIYPER